jgi:hypothetical protein
MTKDSNTLKRITRLEFARQNAKDPDMKRIWGNKVEELKHYGDDPNWRLKWSKFFKRMP